MSKQVWLPLIRSSSPQTLGQAVLRLAELAEAAHMQQTSESFIADESNSAWAPGLVPRLASRDVAAVEFRGRNHMEVNR